MILDPALLDERVRDAQAGDRLALEEVLVAILPRIRWTVSAAVSRRDLVDEVVQECLLAVIEHLDAYEPRGAFLPWVRVVARNRLHEQLRQWSRHFRSLDQDLDALVMEEGLAAEDPVLPMRRLQACLEQLSPRAREILRRRHVDGVPVKRLAVQFKQSAQAIAGILKRSRLALRACLGLDGVTHGS